MTVEQAQALKKAGVKLYWIGCGREDFLFEGSNRLDATLTEAGLEHTYYLNGGGHVWFNWRQYLNIFAQLLVK